ncbi:MAG: hypothetical protein WA871_10145 [Candidatus Acidiferrales bacterium]
MKKRISLLIVPALIVLVLPILSHAQAKTPAAAATADDDARRDAADLAQFEHKAELSKELGATDMLITDGLPLATWEMDADDPYPMWFAHHAGLLIIFPPKDVQPYVDMKYAARVQAILVKRCAILEKYGLKGVWNANEPAVMPEGFFTAFPELRGPRIDQPNRSRKAYFAPSVDEPETLRMYRDSMQLLLKTCPEVEQFNWVTTDAGSGFDWSPSLYPGINGNSNYKDRPMSDRVSGFLINAQQAAKDAGHDIEINLTPIAARQWMIPTFSPDVLRDIVHELPRGLAVQGREGPDGRPFQGVATIGNNGGAAFYPVVGIVLPSIEGAGGPGGGGNGRGGGTGGGGATASPARFMVNFGDGTAIDFNYRLVKFTRGAPMRTLTDRITTLRAFAVSEVGDQQADNLMEVWSALNDAQRNLEILDFGGMLRFGDVLNRWITRPMVPFPEELTAAETKDYRQFLFQAKGDEQAADLVDIQAMREYEGWGAHLLFQRTIELTLPRMRRALSLVQGIAAAATDDAARKQWDLTGKRLQAVIYLLQSADNMVAYQAQLDRVKSLGVKPEANPVLGVQSGWDRTNLMETARNEIDTMVNLNRLLESTSEPILDLAPTPGEETIMRLGPDVSAGIKHKIDVMNAHWRDYDRLFTAPNP